jgi:hypothetical protein
MVKRYVFIVAGMLIVLGSVVYRFITDTDRSERILAVVFGIGVMVLAVLIARGPALESRKAKYDRDRRSSSSQ